MIFQSFIFGLIAGLTIGLADLMAALVSRRIGIFRVLIWTHIAAVALTSIYLPFADTVGEVSATNWGALFGISVLIIVTLSALYKSLQLGPVAVVSPIVSASSVVAIPLAVVFVGERLATGQILGATATIGGVVLVSVDTRQLRVGQWLIGKGVLFAVAAMVGAGVWTYAMGVLSKELGWFPPVYITRLMTLVILIAVQAGVRPWPWEGMNTKLLLGVTLIALSETIGLFAFTKGAADGTISVVAAAMSVYPLVPIAGGLVIFRERLAPNQVVGLAIVLPGLVLLGLNT